MEPYERAENKTDVKDDPKARETLREAFEKTARWQADVQGFSADLQVNVAGRVLIGSVTVRGPRQVTVELPDSEVQKWAENQISMIAVHRGPRTFEESDGKYTLTLGDDSNHPFGPTLSIHGDGMQSSYRIKDGRITQINRKMPHIGFTINIEDSALTKDGKYLTTRYTVYYYSPKDGTLTNVESFTDTHTRVGSSDLPASRRILSYEQGVVVVKSLVFENHKLL